MAHIRINLKEELKQSLLEKIKKLKECESAVYFLLHKEVIVYVRSTKDVQKRLISHMRERIKVFDDYEIINCKKELLDSTELSFIRRFDPAFNTKDSFTKAMDLREYCIKHDIGYEDYSQKPIVISEKLKEMIKVSNYFNINISTIIEWREAENISGEEAYMALSKIYALHLSEIAKGM